MKNPDYLYYLIKSLTKSEKAGFLKYASGEKNYLQLFKKLEKIPVAANTEDMKIMRELGYKSVNTYYVAKNYLLKIILKSLCITNLEKGSEEFISLKLQIIKILYQKTFFAKALEVLKKTKKLCYESGNYLKLAELFKWEKNLVIEGAVKGSKAVQMNRIYEEEISALKKIKNISDYRYLSFTFNSFLKNTSKLSTAELNRGLRKFKNNPLISSENNALTLVSKITLMDIIVTLNMLEGKQENVYKNRKKMVNLLEANPVFREENLTNYIILLYNFAGTCFENGKFDETAGCIAKLKNIMKSHLKKMSNNTIVLVTIGTLRLETERYLRLGIINKAVESSAELEEAVRKYGGIITEPEKAQSLFLAAKALLLIGNNRRSLSVINIILAMNAEKTGYELHVKARLIQILILYEAGIYETVEYNISSLLRAMKKDKTDKMIKVEYEFVKNFLNNLKEGSLSNIFRIYNKEPENKTGLTELIFDWISLRRKLTQPA